MNLISILTTGALALFAFNLVGCAVEETNQHILFRRLGDYAPSTSFAHSRFVINFTDAQLSLELASTLLHKLEDNVYEIINSWNARNDTPVDLREQTLSWEYAFAQSRDELFHQKVTLDILSSSVSHRRESRQPRQVLAGIVASIVGVISGGLFSIGEIATLRQAMATREDLALVTHEISSLANVLSSQDKVLLRLDARIGQLGTIERHLELRNALTRARYQLSQLTSSRHYSFRTFSSGVESLLDGHLSSALLPIETADQVMTTLKQKAESVGLALVFKHTLSLYSSTFTLVQTEEQGVLEAFLHVPLYRPPMFTLYEFLPLPVVVPGANKTATPVPEATFIVVNREGNLFQEVTAAFMASSCHQSPVHGVTYCDSNLPYKKNFLHSCLGSLFQNSPAAILANCAFAVDHTSTEKLVAQDASSFLIYAPRPTPVKISCPRQEDNVVVAGYRRIALEAACSISTANFYVKKELSIRANITLYTAGSTFNTSEILGELPNMRGVTLNSIDEQITSHADVIQRIKADVDRLHEHFAAAQPWSWLHWNSLGTSFTVLVVATFCIALGVVICRKKMAARKARGGNNGQ